MSNIGKLKRQVAKLRPFALEVLSSARFGWCEKEDALAALTQEPDAEAWVSWRTVTVADGTWLWWRDPSDGHEHIDQALTDEDGKIVGKSSCGLSFNPLCQPAVMLDDVLAAIELGEIG